jgi:hypothetical protein
VEGTSGELETDTTDAEARSETGSIATRDSDSDYVYETDGEDEP